MPKTIQESAGPRAPIGIPAAWRARMGRLLVVLMMVTAFAAAPRAAAQDTVAVAAESQKDAAVPGDQFAIAVSFHVEPGWHISSNDPLIPKSWEASGFVPSATEIHIGPMSGLRFGPIQWPKPRDVKIDLIGNGVPEPLSVFEGDTIAYIPVRVEPGAAPVAGALTVTIKFQACDNKVCQGPETKELSVPLKIVTKPVNIKKANEHVFKGFSDAVFARPDQFATVPPMPPKRAKITATDIAKADARDRQRVTFDAFGFGYTVDTASPVGLVLLVISAIVGGLVLNFTPCVLPVIPLKILGLSQSVENPKRCLLLGVMMSLGIIAFWLSLGGMIAFSVANIRAVSQLSSIPWFNLGIGAFMAAMGAGMLGAFSIRLPQWVYSINPRNDTPQGAFMFGVMTAVLTTPCTAPFAGAATAWGSTQSPPLTLMVFAAIGVGMSVPYLVLSFKPTLVEKMPRSGPAGDLVKQVLGLLMFAVAAWFLGTGAISLVAEKPYLARDLYWWGIAAMALIAGLWLTLRTIQISERRSSRILFAVLGMVLAALPMWIAIERTRASAATYARTQAGENVWVPYSESVFNEALASGKIVVLEFTGDWCLNCITLRHLVLDREAVREALNRDDVVAMEVDLTSRQAPGWEKLNELKEVSLPLLAVFTPGQPKPWKSNGYTVTQIVDQIDLARSRAARPPGDGDAPAQAAVESAAGPASGSGR